MKRKIIRQGHNTLTITLPADWVKKFNLKAGEEVDLIEKEGGIFITTEKIDDKKETGFDITEMDIPTIWKYFMAVYREGYDKIIVKFKPDLEIENPYKFFTRHRIDLKYKKEREQKKILESLQGFVSRFIGYEIVEHGKNFIVVKEMGQITSREFESSLRRIFFLIQQMAEETLEALEKNDPKILDHMHDVDIAVDKFHDYCIRILNKIGNKESRKISLLFSTIYLLELIGDEFKNISVHLLGDFPNAKFNNIMPLADSVKEQFDIYYDLFYKFEKEKIKKISEIDKKIYFNFPNIYKKANEEEKEIFHHLRMIGRYINALDELRIEMEF